MSYVSGGLAAGVPIAGSVLNASVGGSGTGFQI